MPVWLALTDMVFAVSRSTCGAHQPAFLRLLSIRIQPRQWHIAARLVHVADDGAAPALVDQPHVFLDEGSGNEAVVFGDAPPYGVVVKARGLGGFVLGARISERCMN